MNLEELTIDELVEYKLARKRQVDALKEEMRAAHAVYTRKLLLQSAAAKLGVDPTNLSQEEADTLVRLAKQTPAKGVVVSPEPAVLTVRSDA